MLSLIVPCYNEEGNVQAFYNEVCSAFEGKVDSYEFVFAGDCQVFIRGDFSRRLAVFTCRQFLLF